MNGPHLPELDVLQVVGRLLIRRRSSGDGSHMIRVGRSDRLGAAWLTVILHLNKTCNRIETINNIFYQGLSFITIDTISLDRLLISKWFLDANVDPPWLRKGAKGPEKIRQSSTADWNESSLQYSFTIDRTYQSYHNQDLTQIVYRSERHTFFIRPYSGLIFSIISCLINDGISRHHGSHRDPHYRHGRISI